MAGDTFATLPITSKVSAVERNWAIINRKIPKEDSLLANIKIASKTHSLTVNSILFAAFMEAVDMECKKMEFENSPLFRVLTAVNIMGGIPLQIGSLNVMAIITEIEKKDGLTFWEIARSYEHQLKSKIANNQWVGGSTDYQELLFSPDYADSVLFEQQGRVSTFSLTNVGDVNRLMNRPNEEVWSHAPFKVENTILSAENKFVGSCFVLAIATFNGNMSLNLSFPVPTYDKAIIKNILESAIAITKQKCNVAKM